MKRLEAGSAEAWRALGGVLCQVRRIQEYEAAFARALALRPGVQMQGAGRSGD